MTQLAVVYETSLTTEPNPTPAGGEIQSREARGESDCPPFPLLVGDPPQMAPPRKLGEYYFPESCCVRNLDTRINNDYFLHDCFLV
jgi:hypothetical protein